MESVLVSTTATSELKSRVSRYTQIAHYTIIINTFIYLFIINFGQKYRGHTKGEPVLGAPP